MSESYDVELSRALKESAAKELGGWEFTPAMRAKVLEQIRAEEAGQPAPAAPAPRRFAPAPILRPLAWVAVAAAAFAVVLNVGIPGASKKDAKTASPSAAPTEMMAITAERKVMDDADAKTGPEAPRAKNVAGAEPGGEAGAAAAQEDGQGGIAMAAAASHTVTELTLPAEATALKAPAPAPAQPNTSFAVTAAASRNVALASGSHLVSLNAGGVQGLNEEGASVWNQPLDNLTDMALVASAPDGRVAVANGTNQLTLLSASGERQRTLNTSAAAGDLLWSADGRLAVAEGSLVFVYSAATGKQEFFVDAGTPADMAFLPDGSFATYGGPVGDDVRLVVVDRKGKLLVERVSATGGRGLAVTAGGSVIVAGGQAYDAAGTPLWPVPTVPLGVAAISGDMVAAWDTQKVFLLNGHDGSVVLEAAWNGGGQGVRKVVPAPDGRYLAILALTEQGPVVWVVDGAGAQVHAEKLGEVPVDLALSGNRLVIMLEHSLLVRELPQ